MRFSILSNISTSFRSLSPGWKVFLSVALILGALLRTIYSGDIEFKYDEHFMFERTQNVGVTESFPWIGMVSGVGTVNPGMSIWVFLGLSRIFNTSTPPELARSVEILNILALFALALFTLGVVGSEERLAWLWTVTLAAVNPLYVLLERKIWAQSTLPFFCVLLLWGWWKRDKAWGAFLMGFIGLLMGQIHMSGFIFMAALLMWTFFFSKSLQPKRPVHWVGLAFGGITSLVFLIPWLVYLSNNPGPSTPWTTIIFNLDHKALLSSIFWQLWATDPSGLGIWYSLGPKEFLDFLEYPLISETPTYLMGLAHFSILCALFYVFYRFLRSFFVKPVEGQASNQSRFLLNAKTNTDLLKNSALWGYGLLISVLGFTLYRHYLIITFPLEFVWLSQLVLCHARAPKRILGLLWICQVAISVGFLSYIHINHGAPTGDYGVGYQFQGR